MFIVDAALAWGRARATWSRGPSGWRASLSVIALSGAALVFAVWGSAWPGMAQVLLWAVWSLGSAFLLRRGWLRLLGPVLFYDVIRLARRGRYAVLRMVYAAILLYFLFTTWAQFHHRRNWGRDFIGGDDPLFYARLAENYFDVFIIVQLVAVCLLTPAYVAGAIAEEKERKTLEFMLATDLHNREIVLGKLVARLANLTLIIITGLPILSILQFLGGIDPNLLLAGFVATFMTVFSLAGFSILCSVHFKKPRDAIASAYLGPLIYVAAGLVGLGVQRSGWSVLKDMGLEVDWLTPYLSDFVDIFNKGNFPVALGQIVRARNSPGGISSVLGSVLRGYVIFHALFGLLCITWAIARLRVVALRQSSERPLTKSERARRRPTVGEAPVFWKEVYVEGRGRTSWLARLVLWGLVLLVAGGFGWFVVDAMGRGRFMSESFKEDINVFATIVGTVFGCLIVLGGAVRAATAITGERDKDTLDFLLTTPLDSDIILRDKYFGTLYGLRRGVLSICVLWVTASAFGGLRVLDVVLLFMALAIYTCAFTMLGLWFSTVCRSGTTATIWTVMTTVGLSVGHWVPCACLYTLAQSGEGARTLMKLQAGFTPPAVLGMLHVLGMEARHSRGDSAEMAFCCLLGVATYAAAAVAFWNAALSPRFRQVTHRDEFSRRRDGNGGQVTVKK